MSKLSSPDWAFSGDSYPNWSLPWWLQMVIFPELPYLIGHLTAWNCGFMTKFSLKCSVGHPRNLIKSTGVRDWYLSPPNPFYSLWHKYNSWSPGSQIRPPWALQMKSSNRGCQNRKIRTWVPINTVKLCHWTVYVQTSILLKPVFWRPLL